MGNFEAWFARSYKGIIIALVAVMAVTLVVLAMQHVEASRPGSNAVAAPAPTFSSTPKADKTPRAVFLGDSYTQGTGASSDATRWTALVAKQEGWREVNRGQGGTGYVHTAGPEGCGLDVCPAYTDRVAEIVELQPDVVVVAGGQNDFGAFGNNPSTITAAINKVYGDLRQGLPNARIIAVGPSAPGAITDAITGLDAAVQAAASANDATYVSLLDPNVITPDMVRSDKQHVIDTGHAAIAARVESAL
ncbi:SGNH/GDSL hydrolase family protein [Curtobacterium sp. BRD11]|uniref:SGNH/GDSL hydrolase family protein n=1 Tax=Curtobacterium sp. BRD11 TaxID=2962581 RepID=UPI002880E6ED|nr:SGNH/GDSL hydrolase family protein [Curtobacterium sp. BRD11]MDT0211257.1 SGNH/GDSL hydrolase family protein [Curtobacterium sp. BRD11]